MALFKQIGISCLILIFCGLLISGARSYPLDGQLDWDNSCDFQTTSETSQPSLWNLASSSDTIILHTGRANETINGFIHDYVQKLSKTSLEEELGIVKFEKWMEHFEWPQDLKFPLKENETFIEVNKLKNKNLMQQDVFFPMFKNLRIAVESLEKVNKCALKNNIIEFVNFEENYLKIIYEMRQVLCELNILSPGKQLTREEIEEKILPKQSCATSDMIVVLRDNMGYQKYLIKFFTILKVLQSSSELSLCTCK